MMTVKSSLTDDKCGKHSVLVQVHLDMRDMKTVLCCQKPMI